MLIDLHTHSLFSDGELLPSELARRAEVAGYDAIAITDHVDMSNIDFVLPRIVKVSKILNKHWKIKVFPGVEITHVPLEEINNLVKFARKNGAKVVIGHGESPVEPVIKGTNRAYIKACVDVLAHPGYIGINEVKLAVKNGVCLEITTRKGHSLTNSHIITLSQKYGAKMVCNNDAHSTENLLTEKERFLFLTKLKLNKTDISAITGNAVKITKL